MDVRVTLAGPTTGTYGQRLLDRVRAALRARHYSARTEDSYVGWIWRFVVFRGKRHPAEWARRRCPGS